MANPLMGKNMPMGNMGKGSPFTNMLNMMKGGQNPQQMMQMFMQKNPNMNKTIQQLQNMANGRSPKDFAMDLIKQNGLDPKEAEQVARMFGGK